MRYMDIELEGQILGTLLQGSGAIDRLAHTKPIEVDYFCQSIHRRMFEEIQNIIAQGHEPSPFTMKVRFPNEPELEQVGGVKYFADLVVSSMPLAFNEHVKQLADLYYRRKLLSLAESMRDSAENRNDLTAREIIMLANAEFESELKAKQHTGCIDSKTLSMQIADGLRATNEVNPTGLKILDKAMAGGLYQGKCYAIAARKKTGKTILATTISQHLNMCGVKHLFVACEMTPTEIHQRNISSSIGRNALDFINEKRTQQDFQQAVCDYRDPGNIFYLPAAGIAFNELRMHLAAAKTKLGISGFILDYFQLVGGKNPKETQVQHFDEIAQWMASFCKQHNMWCLVMAQMNQEDNIRGGEGIRLAFDQVYELKKGARNNTFYFEQMDTRYTPWMSMGTENCPTLEMDKVSPVMRNFL